jgi:hypothetical protein
MNSGDAAPPCPYVGLQPFYETDRAYFFGRDRDQRVITANLLSSSLTILYGVSGVGKSSLLMAGVLPFLRREHPRTPVVLFRDWSGADFRRALARACIDEVWRSERPLPRPAEDLPLDDLLRTCAEAAGDTLLVLFDQFEEYFLYHPKSFDPESFEAQLARVVNREDVDVGLLISLRADSLSALDRFRERIPNLLSNRLILKHLDEEGAAEAMRRPLEVWSGEFAAGEPPIGIEGELVAELIDQVRIGQITLSEAGGSGGSPAEGRFIEAPFLQLVLTRLWDEERLWDPDVRARARLLRLATLTRLGGAKAIVRQHLDDRMTQLDAASHAICSRFFDRLVTPNGAKIACRFDDLERWAGGEVPAATTAAVLDALCRSRILRTVVPAGSGASAPGYEIYHDVLAPAVLAWRARYIAEQQSAELQRQAAEAQARAREKEQDNRRLRLWQRALLAALALSLIAGAYAVIQEKRAMTQSAISGSYRARENPQLSILLAIHAVKLAKSWWLQEKRLPAQKRDKTQRYKTLLERAENALERALERDGPLLPAPTLPKDPGVLPHSPADDLLERACKRVKRRLTREENIEYFGSEKELPEPCPEGPTGAQWPFAARPRVK